MQRDIGASAAQIQNVVGGSDSRAPIPCAASYPGNRADVKDERELGSARREMIRHTFIRNHAARDVEKDMDVKFHSAPRHRNRTPED